MTKEERLELLKQIEKDIYVPSIESAFLDDAKSCAIHSVIEELEQEPKTGHWMQSGTYLECEDCGCGCYVGDLVNGDFNYCPECGRKMEVY